MRVRAVLAAMICVASSGCTHQHLASSTVLVTGTVMDIQHRTVLNNLALLSCHPEALPSHIELLEGVVQVSDEGAFGTAGGFVTSPGRLDIDQVGPAASRNLSEQWATEAVTDPQRLTGLQDLYRSALGLQPLPPPNTVAYLRAKGAARRSEAGNPSTREGSSEGAGGGATPSGGSAGDEGDRSVPIEALLSDVPPPGWFHLGRERDVPTDACYVGRYRDRYVWVTADGMAGLSRFTIAVLGAVKLDPGQSRAARGLTFTP